MTLSPTHVTPWLVVGFAGQALFFSRFLIQWIQSERLGRSTVPRIFWYLSLGGGLILLTYAIHLRDPVFIVGQGMGLIIYLRNLQFRLRERREGQKPV